MTDQQQPPSDQPNPRPRRPEYGEYAPEGWVSPIAGENAQPESAQGSTDAPRQSATREQPGAEVPRNLGVGSPAAPHAPVPVQHSAHAPGAPLPPPSPQPEKTGSMADRIITILLLVFGAVGALQFALGMLSLGAQLEIVAEMLGAESVTAPASMGVLQTVGAIAVLTIYAVALIWSVQRLRVKKLTFWVPLAAGALALVLVVIFGVISVMLVPELLEYSTPENMERLLEQFGQLQ